jgi:plasmid stabilization system protein ParE
VNLEWSTGALLDLERFAEFLHEHHPGLAAVIASEILSKAESLVSHPHLGRPSSGRNEYREIVLRVRGADYVFQHRVTRERVVVLRVFHARENRGI